MNTLFSILILLISPFIKVYEAILDHQKKKREKPTLKFNAYVGSSSWIVSGGKSKTYPSLVCEVVNEGGASIFTQEINIICFDDLQERGSVEIKLNRVKEIAPAIPVKFFVGRKELQAFPLGRVGLKFLVIDTLGKEYGSKIKKFDLRQFV